MGEKLEVFFRELKEDTQERVKEFMGVESEEEANWDNVPLFVLEK